MIIKTVFKVYAQMKNNTRSFQQEFPEFWEAYDWCEKRRLHSWNAEWTALQIQKDTVQQSIEHVMFKEDATDKLSA